MPVCNADKKDIDPMLSILWQEDISFAILDSQQYMECHSGKVVCSTPERAQTGSLLQVG